MSRRPEGNNPDMGLLVTVLGTHPGVGTTLLAANLAAAMADDGLLPVRLVELDETLGHLAEDLGVQPAGAVTDAARLAAGPLGTGRALDMVEPLLTPLTPLAPGLTGLLAAPRVGGGAGTRVQRLGAPATARLLEALRDGADVVVDAPAAFQDPVVTALAMSDRVVVVTSPEGPAVEALSLTLESLALMQVPAARISIVLNHAGGGPGAETGELSPDAEVPVTAVVPDCADLGPGVALVALTDRDHPVTVAVGLIVQTMRPGAARGSRLLRRRAR
jgi:Flp pilus assembly CpaE family ATPase